LRLPQTLNLMQHVLILEVYAADGVGVRALPALYGSYAHVSVVKFT